MARAAISQPLRQAFALAYAMRARPTPELASRYFEALKRVIDSPADEPPATTQSPTQSPVPHG